MYAAWKSANSLQNLAGKNVLIVGGTQGIGAGVATRFAQLGASVAIAGRNEKLATELIEQLKKESKNSQQEFQFFRVDASSVKDLSRFTDEASKYYESHGGLSHLIQSQGVLTMTQKDTSEGMDEHFAITAYSKWFITQKLLPLLKESCIYILAPATKGEIDLNDVEFRNKSTMQRTARNPVFVDAITKEFQTRNENIRFYHLFPGFVNTELLKNSGWNSLLVGGGSLLARAFGRSPIEYADLPVYIATHPSEMKGGLRLSEKAKTFADYSWIQSEENRAKLFQWCEKQELKINK